MNVFGKLMGKIRNRVVAMNHGRRMGGKLLLYYPLYDPLGDLKALGDVLRLSRQLCQAHQHYRDRADWSRKYELEWRERMYSHLPVKTSRPDFGPDQVRCLCQLVPGMQYSGMHRGMHKNIGLRIFTLIREPFYKTTGVRGWRIEVEYQRSYGNFRETIYLEDHNVFPYNDGSWNVNHWIAFTEASRHLAHLHCHHHCCRCQRCCHYYQNGRWHPRNWIGFNEQSR